jgi:hypothetical protein
MTLLRRLNDDGLTRMSAFLGSLKTDAPQDVPLDILTDPATSEGIDTDIEVEPRTFGNHRRAGSTGTAGTAARAAEQVETPNLTRGDWHLVRPLRLLAASVCTGRQKSRHSRGWANRGIVPGSVATGSASVSKRIIAKQANDFRVIGGLFRTSQIRLRWGGTGAPEQSNPPAARLAARAACAVA